MWWGARLDRRGSGRPTSGTASCNGAAPATTAPIRFRRTPAATRPAGVAREELRVGLLRRRAYRRWGSIDQGPDPPASGPVAADGLPGSAPRSTGRRTGSRCTPGDLATGLGSCPIFEQDWLSANS